MLNLSLSSSFPLDVKKKPFHSHIWRRAHYYFCFAFGLCFSVLKREAQRQSSYGVVEGTDPEAQESQLTRSILSQENPRRYSHGGDKSFPFSSVLLNLTAFVVSISCDLYEYFRDLIQECFFISLNNYCAKQLIRLRVAQNMSG